MDLTSLWLPILVSSVAIFFASFLAWMVLPHHKSDWKKLPNEDGFIKAVRDLGIPPQRYMFPHHSSPEEMKSEAFQKKWQEGPRGTFSMWPEAPNMGANMACTFLFYLSVSFCLAYLSTIALTAESDFMAVFRFVGTAAILAYCAGGIQNVIWFKRRMITDLIDGIAYGLITGILFALLWPGPVA